MPAINVTATDQDITPFVSGIVSQSPSSFKVQGHASHPAFESFQLAAAETAFTLKDIKALLNTDSGILTFSLQAGEIQIAQNGPMQRTELGDILIVDFSDDVTIYTRGFEAQCLVIPYHLLRKRDFDIRTCTLKVISGENLAAAALQKYMLDLQSNVQSEPTTQAQILVEPAVALLQVAVMTGNIKGDLDTTCAPDGDLDKIHTFIEQNLYNPELCAAMITENFGMSRAKLYRLADKLGGIQRLIRNLRLERAYQRLAHGNLKSGSIANLAYEVGFGSENAFRRAFKESFGIAPTGLQKSRP